MKHSAKWERCVRRVKRQGTKVNPYAVCTAALKELAYRKRSKNPLRPRDPEHRKLVRDLSKHFAMDERTLKRKGPWPKGKTPPHLKRYRFKRK